MPLKISKKFITNKDQMGAKRKLSDIKFLVIHDTANTGYNAGAMSHYNFVQNRKGTYGSANYYVDDEIILQIIPDDIISWGVGDTWARTDKTRKDIKNSNSLNVELCINCNADPDKAYKNLIYLAKYLISKYKFDLDNVVRHFDATNKPCPGSWKDNNWTKWYKFKKDLMEACKMDDNKVSPWAAADWQWAIDMGLTDGTRPKDAATRQELVSMLKRMFDKIKEAN